MHLIHLLLPFLTLTLAQDLSALVSQYLGEPNPTPRTTGDSSDYSYMAYSADFSACTNAMHGLYPTTGLGTDYAQRLAQQEADIACQICTSLSLSRIDECCGQAASADCFNQYAARATGPVTTARTTGLTATAASTGRTTVTSVNGAGFVRSNREILAESMLMTLLAFLGLAM